MCDYLFGLLCFVEKNVIVETYFLSFCLQMKSKMCIFVADDGAHDALRVYDKARIECYEKKIIYTPVVAVCGNVCVFPTCAF